MQLRWLIPLGALFGLTALADGSGDQGAAQPPRYTAGYLLLPQQNAAAVPVPLALTAATKTANPEPGPTTAVAYQPTPGDIILYDNFNKFHHFIYKLARTEAPIHAAIVIAREDGTPALLEMTGPLAITAKVLILDVEPRLSTYPGTVMVRRIRRPLTVEQSAELTCFAEAQVGKRFAIHRILLLGTPFNCHQGLRRKLFGHTYLNRNRWFCSEMVVAAGTKAQVFDPQVYQANAIYPRDLAYDETLDLSALYHPALSWVAQPAAMDPVRTAP